MAMALLCRDYVKFGRQKQKEPHILQLLSDCTVAV